MNHEQPETITLITEEEMKQFAGAAKHSHTAAKMYIKILEMTNQLISSYQEVHKLQQMLHNVMSVPNNPEDTKGKDTGGNILNG